MAACFILSACRKNDDKLSATLENDPVNSVAIAKAYFDKTDNFLKNSTIDWDHPTLVKGEDGTKMVRVKAFNVRSEKNIYHDLFLHLKGDSVSMKVMEVRVSYDYLMAQKLKEKVKDNDIRSYVDDNNFTGSFKKQLGFPCSLLSHTF